MRNCLMILNLHSGTRNLTTSTLKEIEQILLEHGYVAHPCCTEYAGHAMELVEQCKDMDLVLSYGGDGTFHEVVAGNLKRKDPLVLAHIPSGTTNDIGVMFGLGASPVRNLQLLLKGEMKEVDICTINKEPFVYVAGMGQFTNVPYQTDRKLKKKWGHLAYVLEGTRSFLNENPPLYHIVCELDDQVIEGDYSILLLSNANRVAGISRFYRHVKLDDGKMEVLLGKFETKKDIVQSAFSLTKSRADGNKLKGFSFYRAHHVRIHFASLPDRKWCLDGEELNDSTDTYEFEAGRQKVKMLVPKKKISDLFL